MAKNRDDYFKFRNRIVITILAAYALALLIFFTYSLFTFPEKYFLVPFRSGWTFLRMGAYFIENLIPVHCAAVLVACSVFSPPSPSLKSELQESFKRLILSTVVVFLVAGIVYASLAEGVLPAIYGRLRRLENRTAVARSYLELAEQARMDENWKLRRAYLEYYLTIDPGNRNAVAALAELNKRPAEEESDSENREPRKQARLMDLQLVELFAKAEASLEEEDYYTAYYFADLAEALAPAGSTEADRAGEIAASIQRRLSSYKADSAELQSKALFEIKTQGYSDLSSSELPLVTRAYYTFLHLEEEFPEDREAQKYLAEATEKLRTMAFFRDEVERFRSMPGINQLFFRNGAQLVAIGGIITTDEGTYARDIEAITFDENGETVSHFTAQAGKIMANEENRQMLYMVGLDRSDSSNTLLPEYFVGEPGSVFRLEPSMEELTLLGSEGRDIESHHLNRLWGLWEKVAPFGYPSDNILIVTFMRVASAFTIIILSLIALYLGWKLRPRANFPFFAGIIIVPILPVAAYLFTGFYEYVLKLLVGSALLAWGFVPALIVLMALLFALIAFSISIIAAQSLKLRETED